MTAEATAPTGPALALGEHFLLCPTCGDMLMFTRMTTDITVRDEDTAGDDLGRIARLTYRGDCGCEREVEITQGCMVIVHATTEHAG